MKYGKLKKNHHYVPQFWLKRFRGDDGRLFSWDGKTHQVVSTKNIMQQNWLYTVFDIVWRAHDFLEDILSKIEGKSSQAFERIETSKSVSFSDYQIITEFIALQIVRHPDVLNRGFRRSRDMGLFFSKIHEMTEQDFCRNAVNFGMSIYDAKMARELLLPLSTDQLADQLKDLQSKSPQSPDLPIQEGLFAKNILANILRNMDLELLEAPSGTFFVLGDTPTPQSELSLGFNLPLSKSFALRFSSIRGNQSPATGSRVVTSDEVDKINQDQYNAAASIVIGPNPSAFAKIAP